MGVEIKGAKSPSKVHIKAIASLIRDKISSAEAKDLILDVSQKLVTSGDGCGTCPPCILGSAIVGGFGIKTLIESKRSEKVAVFKDDAFRCC